MKEWPLEPERPSSLANLKINIGKADEHIKAALAKKTELDKVSGEAKALETTADTINRHKVGEQIAELSQVATLLILDN